MLQNFNMVDCKPIRTPRETGCKLMKNDESTSINQTIYRSMTGSLLYLTTSRPDIMKAVCMISRFQSDPK